MCDNMSSPWKKREQELKDIEDRLAVATGFLISTAFVSIKVTKKLSSVQPPKLEGKCTGWKPPGATLK